MQYSKDMLKKRGEGQLTKRQEVKCTTFSPFHESSKAWLRTETKLLFEILNPKLYSVITKY